MENWPEITKDTTIEELKEIHKRIWLYVAEHGEKPKTPYDSDCVLCEWTNVFGGYCCLMCPYKDQYSELDCLNGLYKKWVHVRFCEKYQKLASEIALQIANLELVDKRSENNG